MQLKCLSSNIQFLLSFYSSTFSSLKVYPFIITNFYVVLKNANNI